MAKKILGHMKMSKKKSFDEKFGSDDDSVELAAQIQNSIANKNGPTVPLVKEDNVIEKKEKENIMEVIENKTTNNPKEVEIVEGKEKSKEEKKLDKILSINDLKGGAVTINLSLNKDVRNKFVKLSMQKGLKDDIELDKYSVLRAVLYDYINTEYDKIMQNL